MDTITGHIERITFQNADNGWTVARLQEPGKLDRLISYLPTL